MLGAIISMVAGGQIKRLWPWGAAFILIYTAVGMAFQLIMLSADRALSGTVLDLSANSLAASYGAGLLFVAAFFFIGRGIAYLWRRRRHSTNR